MDPWDWSVEQVINEFCRTNQDRPVWCSPTDPLPNSTLLEQQFRENDVNGEVALTQIDHDTLQKTLAVRSLGQRHALMKGVIYLRARSQKYGNLSFNTPAAPSVVAVQSWLRFAGLYAENHHTGGSVASGVPTGQSFNSPLLGQPFHGLEALHSPKPSMQAGISPSNPPNPAAKMLQTESAPVPEASVQVPTEVALAAPMEDPIQSQPVTKAPRRIAPTFVAHLNGNTRPTAGLLGEDDEAASDDGSLYDASEEGEYEIIGENGSEETRGRASHAVRNYSTSPGMPPMDLEMPSSPHPQGQKNTHDDFDYLLEKYPALPESEDLLALYGDSGDDGNYDEATWLEMEEDKAEDMRIARAERALPLALVKATLDEAIGGFESDWQETKLAKAQAKGFRLWKKAHRDCNVDTEIATAQYWIRRLETSVVKIREAITGEPWTRVDELRKQCQSLEETIFQQQEHRYNVSVLSKSHAPPRPTRRSTRQEKPMANNLAEGEILLESETDLSMSNFIDSEEDVDRTTPTGPPAPRSPAGDQIASDPSYETDDVIFPTTKRRKAKLGSGRVDRRKMPFIESDSARSIKTHSSSPESSDLGFPVSSLRSKFKEVGHDESQPIELLSSSDSTSPAKVEISRRRGGRNSKEKQPLPTTPPQRWRLSQPKPESSVASSLYDAEEIKRVTWETIEATTDHRRALAKAFFCLPDAQASNVRDFIRGYTEEDFESLLQAIFNAIINRDTNVDGVEECFRDTAKGVALLFASYSLAKRVLDEPHFSITTVKEAQKLVRSGSLQFLKTLKEILREDGKEEMLRKGKRKNSEAALLGDAGSLDAWGMSETDSGTRPPISARKKRRRIKQSQAAISTQLAGQLRLQEEARRIASIAQKYESIPGNKMKPSGYAIGVNEPQIFLDEKIGQKAKPHQVTGVRFMWREIINDPKKQGCLLAHTMGLGKTMQVVSLLATIAQAATSTDEAVRSQIPVELHNSRTLILCPPSLIDNWYEEVIMWRPDTITLGQIFKITQDLPLPERIRRIAEWVLVGGVLIISYDMFRNLVANKGRAGRNGQGKPLSDEDHAAAQEYLLNRPTLIIADEAHKMKNTEAGISLVTSRFRSQRRIALTGSPLANNLDEYFAMIDWIAPGYLGSKEQFRSKYAIPIEAGLYKDSDAIDRRISLRKLHVLKKNLDPKIDRADISAIADDLPSKTEFFITIPLTRLQSKAYNLYVTALLGSTEDANVSGNARLWDWLAILSLLCNHPCTFLNKLDDRLYSHDSKSKKTKRKKAKSPEMTTDEMEGAGLPADIVLANAGLSPELIEQQRNIFRDAEDSGHLEDPSLSYRAQIVCEIIRLAVEADDKVLLFSHSIPTLDYLEAAVSSMGYSTCRLDGSTKVSERQTAVKAFNNEPAKANVFFISTRAGGLGLNLQGANRVILVDYGFNPIWEEQAIGRAYRLGQRKAVFVYRLRAGGTFEELIYNKAVFKTQLSARVVDQKNPMRHASKKATDYLFPAKEVHREDLSPYFGKDPEVLDHILGSASYICDVTLTETFQKEDGESLTAAEVQEADIEFQDEKLKRDDPVGYAWKMVQRQKKELLTARPAMASQAPGRAHGYPPPPGFSSTVPLPPYGSLHTIRPLPKTQPTGLISRPEAVSGPRQAEGYPWDQRTPSHILHRTANLLGAKPFENVFQTKYPSPTTEQRPTSAKKTPDAPTPSEKQLDGPTDAEDDNSGIEQCKNQ